MPYFTLGGHGSWPRNYLPQAHVSNLGLICMRQQDVGALDVKVEDSPTVQVVQALGHIQRNASTPVLIALVVYSHAYMKWQYPASLQCRAVTAHS